MVQENVDVLLAGIQALNNGDVDGAMAPFDEQVIFIDHGTGMRTETREALRSYIVNFLGSFDQYRETVESVHVCEEDVVVIDVRATAVGRASGLEMDERHGEMHRFADGRVVEINVYPTIEAALEAVGPAE